MVHGYDVGCFFRVGLISRHYLDPLLYSWSQRMVGLKALNRLLSPGDLIQQVMNAWPLEFK